MSKIPNLPKIKYSSSYQKGYITQFDGINRLSLGVEGAMYDALNMSAVNFPTLSTRLGFAKVKMADKDGSELAVDEKILGMANLTDDAFALFGRTKIWSYSYGAKYWTVKAHGGEFEEEQHILAYGKEIVTEKGTDNEVKYKYGVYLFMPSMHALVHWLIYNKDGELTDEGFSAGSAVHDKITIKSGDALDGQFSHLLPGFPYKITATVKGELATSTITHDKDLLRVTLGETQQSISIFDKAAMAVEEALVTYTVPLSGGVSNLVIEPKTTEKIDNAFIHSNRIWGYKGRTIYASKLGLGLDFTVDGTDAGGWSVETLLQEDITAGCSFGGHPVFFTENYILTVYGDYPSEYSISTYDAVGVSAESAPSLTKCSSRLYYLSEAGVMRYQGGTPVKISDPLTLDLITNGKGAADSENYYLWAEKQGDENGKLYVYNIPTGAWNVIQYGGGVAGESERESTEIESPVLRYISNKEPSVNEVMLFDNGAKTLYCVPYQTRQTLFPNTEDTDHAGYNHPHEWRARFGRFFIHSPNMKEMNQIQIRARLVSHPTEYDSTSGTYKSHLRVKICYDDNDIETYDTDIMDDRGFELLYEEVADSRELTSKLYGVRNILVPLQPRRCDSFKLELSGDGRWEIQSMTLNYRIDSERR